MNALKFSGICMLLAESIFCLVFPGKINTENSVMDLDFSPLLKSKPFRFHQHLTTADMHRCTSISTPSQGLKLKISFHKVLGQGLNGGIMNAFECNHVLDLAVALFLFVYQLMYLQRLCSLGSTGGFLAISSSCKRGAKYVG